MFFLFIKRLIDFFGSLFLLAILSPLLIPVMIILLFTGEGYIFYFQERIGYKNKRFNIWKFATMLKASPQLGAGHITITNDWRVTPFGKYLRSSKINEIPQIFNVLLGDMSFVGPRPLVDRPFNAYPEHLRDKVYLSKPGITGIGSIVFRDEEKIVTHEDSDPHENYKKYIAPYKGELEIWYLNNKSLAVDIKIMILTIYVVASGKTDLIFKWFRNLPEPPENLKKYL